MSWAPRVCTRSKEPGFVSWLVPLAVGALILGAGVVYWPSLRHFFSQDDFVFLERASRVRGIKDFVILWLAPDHFYRPVPRVGFFVVAYQLFGLNAWGFHALSLLVHIANAVLLLVLLVRLTGKRAVAVFAGFIYATHASIPFLAVYWVSGVHDLSVTLWTLLALLMYLSFRESGRTVSLMLSLAAGMLALLSKEMAVTLPALVVVTEIAYLHVRHEPIRPVRVLSSGLLYALLVSSFLVLRAQKASVFIPTEGPYGWDVTLGTALKNLTAFVTDAVYLRTWAASCPPCQFLIWSVLALLVGATLLVHPRAVVPVLFGLSWFLITLVPTLFLSQRIYSYYAYLPLAGMVTALATCLWHWIRWTSNMLRTRNGLHFASGYLGLVLAMTLWLPLSVGARQLKTRQDPAGILSKSVLARQVATEVQLLYPTLPPGSTLYVVGVTERDIWALGHGSLFRLYYPETNVVFLDEDDGFAVAAEEQGFVYRFRR